MIKDISICVATPTKNSMVYLSYVKFLFGLYEACQPRGIRIQYSSSHSTSVLPATRNLLADHFLHQTDASHLLFLDSDMGFNPVGMMRMFDYADRDVVAAIYAKKRLSLENIARNARAFPEMSTERLLEL